MRLVECIREFSNDKYRGPKKHEICEVEGEFKYGGYKFYHLAGYNYLMASGRRVDFHSVYFREIEFPPSLEQEIKESLTRELQPV